jgi:hypothetical protein
MIVYLSRIWQRDIINNVILENSDIILISRFCLIFDIIACKDQRENVQIINKNRL